MLQTEIQSRDCGVAAGLYGMSIGDLNNFSIGIEHTAAQAFPKSGGFEHDLSNAMQRHALQTGQTAVLALEMIDVVRKDNTFPRSLKSKISNWYHSYFPVKTDQPNITGEMISARTPRIVRISTRNPIDLWRLPAPTLTEKLSKVNEARQAALFRFQQADSKVAQNAAAKRLDFLGAQKYELQLAENYVKATGKYDQGQSAGNVVPIHREGGLVHG